MTLSTIVEQHKPIAKKPHNPRRPSITQLERWMDQGYCEATDGCIVKPDGICPHGCQSWLLVMGMI